MTAVSHRRGKRFVLALLILGGCTAVPPRVWYRPGETTAAFNADKGFCEAEANAIRGRAATDFVREGTFDDCLKARGWVLRQRAPNQAANAP